jgi:hypothetical protein
MKLTHSVNRAKDNYDLFAEGRKVGTVTQRTVSVVRKRGEGLAKTTQFTFRPSQGVQVPKLSAGTMKALKDEVYSSMPDELVGELTAPQYGDQAE